MNIQLSHRIIKKVGLTSLILLSQITTVHALDVSINGSEPLPLNSDISYDFQVSPGIVGFEVGSPIVCSSISNSLEPLVLLLSDSNNSVTTTSNIGIISTIYDLIDDRVRFLTDNTIKCATEGGLHREAISRLGFESGEDDLQITLLDFNGQPFDPNAQVSDEQSFVYQYVIDNNGVTTITADIDEFYNTDSDRPIFSGVVGNDWSCIENNLGTGSNTTCGITFSGEDTVELTNAVVEPGEQLIITASRIVEVPDDQLGTNIDVLAAAFVKNADDTIVDNNVVFQAFGTTDNNIPTITTIADQTLLEDGVTGVINFNVSDIESDDASLTVTASSSDTSVISPANIVITNAGGSNRNVQITPNAGANTAAGVVTVTLTVSDGVSTSDESFDVTVTPVNDAPTFTLQAITDFPAGSIGLQPVKDFVENLSFGDSADEASQSLIETFVTIQSDPNGVIANGFEPVISNGGFLTYGLSGRGGTAIVDVILRDDGGVANGGVDTSVAVSFSITVLNTLPVISVINDVTFDEDSVSDVINFSISDAETIADDLVVSASSSDTSIIPVGGIQFSGAAGARSLVITPAVDQNTFTSSSVTITVMVDDGSDVAETTFDVIINPINDAPSFDLDADIVWPAASSGLQLQASYANNIQLGPTMDENSTQSVVEFNAVSSGDAIFSSSPIIDANGSLAYVLNGVSGVATINVTLQDDGGVADGGVDTSAIQTFTITVQ